MLMLLAMLYAYYYAYAAAGVVMLPPLSLLTPLITLSILPRCLFHAALFYAVFRERLFISAILMPRCLLYEPRRWLPLRHAFTPCRAACHAAMPRESAAMPAAAISFDILRADAYAIHHMPCCRCQPPFSRVDMPLRCRDAIMPLPAADVAAFALLPCCFSLLLPFF